MKEELKRNCLSAALMHGMLLLLIMVIFPIQLIPYWPVIIYQTCFVIIVLIYVLCFLTPKEIFNAVSFCLTGIAVLTLINNRLGNISFRVLLQGTLHYAGLILLYDLLMVFNKKERNEDILNSFILAFFIYTVGNAISVAVLGVNSQYNLLYLFGNKFRTSYYLIYLLGFVHCKTHTYIRRFIPGRLAFLLLVCLAIAYIYFITCSTALIAMLFFLLMTVFERRESKLIKQPVFILCCMLASGLAIFTIKPIASIPIVQKLLSMIGEDPTLTGRTIIYSEYLLPLIKKSPFIGFGFGNWAMMDFSGGFGNAQNGMFDFILNHGIIGLALFFVIAFLCLGKSKWTQRKYGLYLVLFSMIVIAIIEVPFGAFMLVILFAIRWYEADSRNIANSDWTSKNCLN